MSTNTMTDQMLIARYQRGDKGALDALLRIHEPSAQKFAYRLCHDIDDASDVVAEAFVHILRSIDRFKFESTFTTWLYRILTNCFFDMRRKANTRPAISLDSACGEASIHNLEAKDLSPYELAEMRARD